MTFPLRQQHVDANPALHDNRFRSYDPAVGRYISADPIGQAGGVNLYAYAGNDPLNWFDPFGLTEGSASNKAKRKAIAAWAASQNKSTSFSRDSSYAPGYSYDAAFGPQYPGAPNPSWKCSAFTCAAAASADADTVVTVPDGKGGSVDRCPTAGELAGPGDISNWRVLGPGETPEAGDIAAAELPGGTDYTGHAAVVIDAGMGGTTTIGAHANEVGPPGADRFRGPPTHRRYIGD